MTPKTAPRTAGMAALLAAMEPELGVPLADDWRPKVLSFLEMAAAAADLYVDLPLDDDTDQSAIVFRLPDPEVDQ